MRDYHRGSDFGVVELDLVVDLARHLHGGSGSRSKGSGGADRKAGEGGESGRSERRGAGSGGSEHEDAIEHSREVNSPHSSGKDKAGGY